MIITGGASKARADDAKDLGVANEFLENSGRIDRSDARMVGKTRLAWAHTLHQNQVAGYATALGRLRKPRRSI